MRRSARLASILLTSVLALGALTPAFAAEAASPTATVARAGGVLSSIPTSTTSAMKTVAAAKKKAPGTIRVQVKTPAGKALKVAKIGLYLVTSGKFHRTAKTNKSGVATFTKVPSGTTYYLGTFDDTADAKLAYVQANTVVKVAAKKTKKVSLKLAAKVKLSGRVIDNHGAAVASANVTLSSSTGTVLKLTKTAADGSYAFPYLRGGKYRVSFNTYIRSVGNTVAGDSYSVGYWKDSTDYATATVITAHVQTSKKAATRLTNVDATLTKFTAISGTTNLPENTLVTFTNAGVTNNSVFVKSGAFSVVLPAAAYTVSYYSENGTSIPDTLYYTGDSTAPSADESLALPVTITAAAGATITLTGATAPAPSR